MIYNVNTRELRTNDGTLLKVLNCPLQKHWSQLTVIQDDAATRHCESCNKLVMNLEGITDSEAERLFQEFPLRCVFIPPDAENIKIVGYNFTPHDNPCPFRRIQTARGEEAINQGVKDGYWPLVKRVKPSSRISTWTSVYQHEETGDIKTISDYRSHPRKPWNCIIEPFTYYPYPIEHQIAAYLLPSDLAVGERVFLVDLIEDLVGYFGNQNHTLRAESSYAIWNGKDFDIQWDEKHDACWAVG